MCQPSPLGRCVNGANIELTKAKIELGDAVMNRIETKREYEAGAKAYSEFFNNAEGDEPELEEFWNAASAAMEKMSNANLRVMAAEREMHQKQLLVDATNTGLKHLKEDRNVEDRALRIKNATAQREWTERIRKAVKAEDNVSDVAASSHKAVLYNRMLQEENANYEASQELERRYSGSATSLSESIAKMEQEDLENKDEQIEILAKVRNADRIKAKRYSSEMAMYSTRIKDLTTAIKDLDMVEKDSSTSTV